MQGKKMEKGRRSKIDQRHAERAAILAGELLAALPPLISRSEVPRLLGGMISKRQLEKDDALGHGPHRRVSFNGKIGYPRQDLFDYLLAKGLVVIEAADDD